MEEKKTFQMPSLLLCAASVLMAVDAVKYVLNVSSTGVKPTAIGVLLLLVRLAAAVLPFIAGSKYSKWAYLAYAGVLALSYLQIVVSHPGALNLRSSITYYLIDCIVLALFILGAIRNKKAAAIVYGAVHLFYPLYLLLIGARLDAGTLLKMILNLGVVAAICWMLGEKEENLWKPKVKPIMQTETYTINSEVNQEMNNGMKFCVHCGKETMAAAVVCPHCGCPTAEQQVKMVSNEPASTGEKVVACLLPIVGLILYLVNNDKAPAKAKEIGKWALIGMAVGVGCVLLSSIIGGAALASFYY